MNGKSAYLVTGNWAASAIEEAMGDDVGFFLLPQGADGRLDGGVGRERRVLDLRRRRSTRTRPLPSSTSCRRKRLPTVQFETGFMPVNSDAAIEATGVRADIADAFKVVVGDNGIVPFPDFASPNMIDRLTAGVQGLISKQLSPADYLASLQDSWTEYHG